MGARFWSAFFPCLYSLLFFCSFPRHTLVTFHSSFSSHTFPCGPKRIGQEYRIECAFINRYLPIVLANCEILYSNLEWECVNVSLCELWGYNQTKLSKWVDLKVRTSFKRKTIIINLNVITINCMCIVIMISYWFSKWLQKANSRHLISGIFTNQQLLLIVVKYVVDLSFVVIRNCMAH